MVNRQKLQQFRDTYAQCLQDAVQKYPQDYPWRGKLTVEKVADSMAVALERGSYNKDGHAMQATCKKLGLAHTYKAIDLWLHS